MCTGKPVLCLVAAAGFVLLMFLFGPMMLAYMSALAGIGIMLAMMVCLAFVSLRTWQLGKWPNLHLPQCRACKWHHTDRRAA